jgi:hypothetical protein
VDESWVEVEGVEAAGDGVDDSAEVVEGLIAEVVGTDVGPDVLDRVELGAVRRQREQGHV